MPWFIGLLCLLACTACRQAVNKKSFEREQEFFRYLGEVHQYSSANRAEIDGTFFILQHNICALCLDETNQFLEDYVALYPQKNIHFIAVSAKRQAVQRYNSMPAVRLLQDPHSDLSRYGLASGSHLFLEIQAGQIVNWARFGSDNQTIKLRKSLGMKN